MTPLLSANILEKTSIQDIFSQTFIEKVEDCAALFPQNLSQLERIEKKVVELCLQALKTLFSIPQEEKTFRNTVLAFDQAQAFFYLYSSIVGVVINTYPDKEMRDKALEIKKGLSQFAVEHFSSNKTFFKHLQQYLQTKGSEEKLDEQQQYYLKDLEKNFKKAGFYLEGKDFEKACKLKKEISELAQEFSKNIAEDNSKLLFSKQQLQGISESFISQLLKEEEGYKIGMDYPTYFHLMENLELENSRRLLYLCFNQRAYPRNEEILKTVITKRHELALLLGYDNYAQMDLDGDMAGSPERVHAFIDALLPQVQQKSRQELQLLRSSLSEHITLDKNGLFKPWDLAFLSNHVKKQHHEVDEELLAEYFPLDKVLNGFFSIYQEFFGFTFSLVSISLWHESVQLLQVKDSQDKLIGYVALDLFPREGKYTHACSMSVLPPLTIAGSWQASLNVVLANFTSPTKEKPSLLKFNEVLTFFHEMGHALHALCGKAKMPTLAAYNTKLDFVELPSQILEEWVWEETILKRISSHYKTQKPLESKWIENKLSTKRFDSGRSTLRQLTLAKLSLSLFELGQANNVRHLFEELSKNYNPEIYFEKENAFESAFGHLMGYGSKYYCYLWAKVFSLDIFSNIKQQKGLLSTESGEAYHQGILAMGGGKDPNELIESYLKRKPCQKAFLRDLGLVV